MDFSWLNEIPDGQWDSFDFGGMHRRFPLQQFLRQSEASPDVDWRALFDIRGATQSRRYGQFKIGPMDGMPAVQITRI